MSSHVKGCDVMCVTHSPFFSSSSDLSTAGTGHICVRHTGSYTHQIKSCHIKSHHIKYIYILLISFLSFLSIHPSILHYHTSYHIISHDVISYDNILYHVLTCTYIILCSISRRIISCTISNHTISFDIVDWFIVSHHIMSHHILLICSCTGVHVFNHQYMQSYSTHSHFPLFAFCDYLSLSLSTSTSFSFSFSGRKIDELKQLSDPIEGRQSEDVQRGERSDDTRERQTDRQTDLVAHIYSHYIQLSPSFF